MKHLWILLVALVWAEQVAATDNHSYQAGEYAIISGGESPNGRWSISAHGNGLDGSDEFHLYLMSEPTHERLIPLSTGTHLDTGPLSIVGVWAPDSSCVTVLYRSDRHIMDLRLFRVADGKVQSVDIPSLVSVIGHQYFKSVMPYELFSRYYRVSWQNPNHLAVEEFDTFDATEPIFRSGLETYLKVDRLSAERTFTNFSASAVYDITEKDKPRLSEMKPLPDQERTIIYSPHLRFDPQAGLHNTETTSSSQAAPK